MSARRDDASRIEEILTVIAATARQMDEVGVNETSFKHPADASEELVADGLIARVLRVTEEAGCLSSECEAYGIPVRSCRDMRNIIAHTYWRVDRAIAWHALTKEFPVLYRACKQYCDDHGIPMARQSALDFDPDQV